MKINKNSWHYRILTKGAFDLGGMYEWNVSNNLCLYFWQVVFVSIKYLLVCSILAFLFGILVILPLSALLGLIVTTKVVPHLGFAILWVESIAIALYGSQVLGEKLHNYFKNKESTTSNIKKSEPNIVLEYIKAKKQKICPVLEFTEDE